MLLQHDDSTINIVLVLLLLEKGCQTTVELSKITIFSTVTPYFLKIFTGKANNSYFLPMSVNDVGKLYT